VVDHEPLIVLMPSDHHLTSREAIHQAIRRRDLHRRSNKATVLRAVTEDYLRRCGLDIKLITGGQFGDGHIPGCLHRGWRLCPPMRRICCRGPWSGRPLEGEAPTIDLAVVTARQTARRFSSCSFPGFEELRAPVPRTL